MKAGIGAAHDGQQAVKEERHDRRRSTDAEKRDHEDEKRERGDRLDDADDAEDDLPEFAPAGGNHAERDREDDRRRQRDRHQGEMFDRVAPEAGKKALHRRRHVEAERLRQEPGGDLGFGHALQFHLGVHRRHRRLPDAALEAQKGGGGGGRAGGKVGAIEIDGVIGREVAKIVGQYLQPVIGDFGVGGIEVDDVDTAAHQAAVGEVVVEPAHLRLGQTVTLP